MLTPAAGNRPFAKWPFEEIAKWAKAKDCDEVETILKEYKYKGSVLAGWDKADFEKYLGGAYGASFFGHLLGTLAVRARLVVVVGSRGCFSPNRGRADIKPPSTLCGRCWYIVFLCII